MFESLQRIPKTQFADARFSFLCGYLVLMVSRSFKFSKVYLWFDVFQQFLGHYKCAYKNMKKFRHDFQNLNITFINHKYVVNINYIIKKINNNNLQINNI